MRMQDNKSKIDVREYILEKYPIRFTDMAECDGNVWFSACNFNGLFSCNIDDGTIRYKGMFPGESPDQKLMFGRIITFEKKLFFCPSILKYVVMYDINRGVFKKYDIPEQEDVFGFIGAVAEACKNYLFIWTPMSNKIYRFDMGKGEFQIVNNGFLHEKDEKNIKLFRSYSAVSDMLYIPSIAKGGILKIDIKNNKKDFYSLPDQKGIYTICYDGKSFWLTDIDNQLIEWQPDQKLVKHRIDDKYPIKDAILGVFYENKIYYTLMNSNELLVVNLKTMGIETIEMYNDGQMYIKNEGLLIGSLFLKLAGERIWTFSNAYSCLQYIKNDKICCKNLKLAFNVNQYIQDRWNCFCINKTVKEDEIRLKTYLNYIFKYYDKSLESYKDKDFGERIYSETSEKQS